MPRRRSEVFAVYLEPLLQAVLQEGVLSQSGESASLYARNLIFADLKTRGLITPEIMEALVTGQTLTESVSVSAGAKVA